MNLIPISNNARIPNTFATINTNYIFNCRTKHKMSAAGCSSIQPVFINGYVGTNQESNAFYDFVLQSALLYKGTYYPFTFGGATSKTVPKEWGLGVCDEKVVQVNPGDNYYITNRRVATDGGAAGTYNVIATGGGQTFRQDGIIQTSNPAIDYTLGVGLADGYACLPTPAINDAAGTITSISVDPAHLGSGASGGLNLWIWNGPANNSQPGSDNPGTGAGGYGNTGGGQITSVSVTGGGSKYRSVNPAKVFVGGAGTAASGYGSATQLYGPSVILGRPLYKSPGVLIFGDSTAAYGSTDTMGDLDANYALYEQLLGARGIGNFNFSVSGESIVGWLLNNTKQKAFITYITGTLGAVIDNVIVALGTNDFNSNNNSDVIATTQANLAAMVTYGRSLGAKVFVTTLQPFTTGTFDTLAGQTVGLVGGASTNYASGGRVEQYNSSLINFTVASDGVIDISSLTRAPGVNSGKFRVDAFNGNCAFTADGIHYSNGVGKAYLLKKVQLPQFYAR